MNKTRIISAFPACGKTTLFEKGYEGAVILDSDSSNYSWSSPEVRDPDFPDNYMQHIKENIGKVDYIFVSSHIDVRNALDSHGLAWCFVVPDKSLMMEWIGRCYVRGDSYGFIDTLTKNWDNWTGQNSDPMPNAQSTLKSGQHLEDAMHFLATTTYN